MDVVGDGVLGKFELSGDLFSGFAAEEEEEDGALAFGEIGEAVGDGGVGAVGVEGVDVGEEEVGDLGFAVGHGGKGGRGGGGGGGVVAVDADAAHEVFGDAVAAEEAGVDAEVAAAFEGDVVGGDEVGEGADVELGGAEALEEFGFGGGGEGGHDELEELGALLGGLPAAVDDGHGGGASVGVEDDLGPHVDVGLDDFAEAFDEAEFACAGFEGGLRGESGEDLDDAFQIMGRYVYHGGTFVHEWSIVQHTPQLRGVVKKSLTVGRSRRVFEGWRGMSGGGEEGWGGERV